MNKIKIHKIDSIRTNSDSNTYLIDFKVITYIV